MSTRCPSRRSPGLDPGCKHRGVNPLDADDVCRCEECEALVYADDYPKHKKWHAGLRQLTMPLTFIGSPTVSPNGLGG